MLVAEQKQKTNIAEYVLYMYQIEDLIRACQFDLDVIINNVVKPQLPDTSFIPQYEKWYTDLIARMKSQHIEKTGHLMSTQEIVVELSYLHSSLLNFKENTKYKTIVETALPHIEEFKAKSNLKDKNEVEIVFHAMYMKLLLRLQKKEISPASEESFDAMRVLLAYLSRSYIKMKAGETDFLNP